jgi:hypothetical protein
MSSARRRATISTNKLITLRPKQARHSGHVSGFEKMLVLYRPSPHGVEILRVVHGSRNIAALLRREGVE